MRILLITLVSAACVGCTWTDVPTGLDGWQLIHADEAFTFRAPPDVRPVPVQGIDSFVGRYANPGMELEFDYGQYSDSIDREGFTRIATTISGKQAIIATKDNLIGVHFPDVGNGERLTMQAELRGVDPRTVEKIFRSIEFPE